MRERTKTADEMSTDAAQAFSNAIQVAFRLADSFAATKKRYVHAVLILCMGDISTGRITLAEMSDVWFDGHLLVDTILRLGLPEDVPVEVDPVLRERAESRRHLLDPAFVVQPWWFEEAND